MNFFRWIFSMNFFYEIFGILFFFFYILTIASFRIGVPSILFLTMILFNFLVQDCWWTVHGAHGIHTWVCSVIFCDILDCKPSFLVFLLILNWVVLSLVGLLIDMTVQASFLVCCGFIFCSQVFRLLSVSLFSFYARSQIIPKIWKKKSKWRWKWTKNLKSYFVDLFICMKIKTISLQPTFQYPTIIYSHPTYWYWFKLMWVLF